MAAFFDSRAVRGKPNATARGLSTLLLVLQLSKSRGHGQRVQLSAGVEQARHELHHCCCCVVAHWGVRSAVTHKIRYATGGGQPVHDVAQIIRSSPGTAYNNSL